MRAVERNFRKMALVTGRSLGQLLAEIAYNRNWAVRMTRSGRKFQPEVPYNVRLRAIELYLSIIMKAKSITRENVT